jgi:hypothetical protein
MLSKVLLPQPDGPMMETTSPVATEKVTSLAASTSDDVPCLPKRLSTPINSIAVFGEDTTFIQLVALLNCFLGETIVHLRNILAALKSGVK